MNFQCTLWKTNIAMENSHLSLIDPLEMVISYTYVSLPEGEFLQNIMALLQLDHHYLVGLWMLQYRPKPYKVRPSSQTH